ncbi:uncharacterized protein I206_101708 [Kwoniella pini CBS 10737]|uniref:BZIP domain-containing protein n=1 Tax=Kwoniella pini CBS 10737 TaxID=1296096 RepID=A0AAJ8L261_9TREE
MSSSNAVASSSKRSAPSPTLHKAAKRPRASTSSAPNDDEDDLEDKEESEHEGSNLPEDLKAKIARKEARTIRNRESAQRSRNQRKAHLAFLEQRVVELEAENRALKGGESMSNSGSPVSPSSYSGREASPAQSVISLANDLGIPSELVNGTGVRLSNVAPPPADLDMEDVKPNIHHFPSPVPDRNLQPSFVNNNNQVDQLKAENSALRERISLLENLVKQVVAVANFSGLSTSQDVKPSVQLPSHELVSPTTTSNIDWSSFLSAPVPVPSVPGLESTLSPPYYSNTISDVPSTTTKPIQPSANTQVMLENNVTRSANPVARHPAEVATLSLPVSFDTEKGQNSFGSEIGNSFGTSERLDNFNNNVNYNFVNNANGGLWNGAFENGINQLNTSVESMENWDEAMKNLIEDIEGRNNKSETENQLTNEHEQNNGSFLGMEWFGGNGENVVV